PLPDPGLGGYLERPFADLDGFGGLVNLGNLAIEDVATLPLTLLFSGGIVFLFFLRQSLHRRERNGSGQQAAYGGLKNRFFHSVYWVNGCLERRLITSIPARVGKFFLLITVNEHFLTFLI